MKTIVAVFIAAISLLPVSAEDITEIPIRSDSTCPYDFRGKPEWNYPPYQKLFQTKTYGELSRALEEFFEHWKEEQPSQKGVLASNAYYTCKQAMLRLLYLSGEVEMADRLLEEFHPKNHVKEEEAEKLLAANIERDRIRRVAEEIRFLYMDMVAEEPYPNGMPETLHELYRPLFKILRDLAGE